MQKNNTKNTTKSRKLHKSSRIEDTFLTKTRKPQAIQEYTNIQNNSEVKRP